MNHTMDGTFTFQVSLFKNGTIHFVYKEVRELRLVNQRRGCGIGQLNWRRESTGAWVGVA